eukprot:TRINITY_DN21189_c0_g1_i4.p1 TRINITY_DN21189_c0_g1~~TRINITY_DN21189_c0_g1_i4.p1  ORF type:complete len:125 (+),score=23.62 TRINITY_DN21189_c0_g1_i4:162-536(+)
MLVKLLVQLTMIDLFAVLLLFLELHTQIVICHFEDVCQKEFLRVGVLHHVAIAAARHHTLHAVHSIVAVQPVQPIVMIRWIALLAAVVAWSRGDAIELHIGERVGLGVGRGLGDVTAAAPEHNT